MMVIALDYGERYIGIAITDSEGRLALRHSVVDQKKEDVTAVVWQLVKEEDVKRVLVGVPLNLEGEETEQTHVSLAFVERLREVLPAEVEIEEADETLTSVEAESRVEHEGGKKDEAHAEAARLILGEYLQRGQRNQQDRPDQ